jgi:hypothetical protein
LSCDERDVTDDRRNYSGASENKKKDRTHLKHFHCGSRTTAIFPLRARGLWGQIEASRCVTPPQFQISFSAYLSAATRFGRAKLKYWHIFNHTMRAIIGYFKVCALLPGASSCFFPIKSCCKNLGEEY